MSLIFKGLQFFSINLVLIFSTQNLLFAENSLWSLKPIKKIIIPNNENTNWALNSVDEFILRKLSAESLSPSARANRRSIIRRASYDLTGLPPRPETVRDFLNDPDDDAISFAKVVNKLLESKAYGEKWGRHWLDVVRYADTAGENSDHPVEDAWRYRNWVIQSFNNDMPYDQFVREQIAGDILAVGKKGKEFADNTIASGYLAIARRFGHDIDKRMYLTYEDVIDNLGKTFLGLSIACARCHDHKHDPITSADYYALYGVMASSRLPFPGCEPKQQPRDLVALVTDDVIEENKVWEEKLKKLQHDLIENPKKELIKVASESYRMLSEGHLPVGKSVDLSSDPIKINIRKSEAIQISIAPNGNHGADTTLIELKIKHQNNSVKQEWTTQDLVDILTKGNPLNSNNATWYFLDIGPKGPRLLNEKEEAINGQGTLKKWSIGGLPSVAINNGNDPIKAWTKIPARSFFVHPSADSPVAVTWISPVTGKIEIELKIVDGHAGGDGVIWQLQHFANHKIHSSYEKLSIDKEGIAKIEEHKNKKPISKTDYAYAVAEGTPKDYPIHNRGDAKDLGPIVKRRFLTVLGGDILGDKNSSGRLGLANKIVSSKNPLTARVMVNRIWAWHFGRGIVQTLNDFGNHGTLPTHPELLDYLAKEFINGGWSIKKMHRIIMNSATYQQSAQSGTGIKYYAGFERRRLNAEEIRDSILLLSGMLDQSTGREHPFPQKSKWNFSQHAPFADEYFTSKRSVYMMRKRNRISSFFSLFDGPDPNASTANRSQTTVPSQALYFMNDPFFHDCADQLSANIRAIGPDERLEYAYQLLFSRPANKTDHEDFEAFAKVMAPKISNDPEEQDTEIWRSYSRILMSSNEFLYLD
ncbi:MAG: DUF1549 and DUF1553 domain-containing protein [Verrucomicrobiales bacterium]